MAHAHLMLPRLMSYRILHVDGETVRVRTRIDALGVDYDFEMVVDGFRFRVGDVFKYDLVFGHIVLVERQGIAIYRYGWQN